MLIKSQRERYEEDLIYKYNDYDIFVWGEDMIDKKLIVYPKKLKEIAEYPLLKEKLKPCGLVLIDVHKKEYMRCISATVDTQTGNIYISEKVFNSIWRIFRKSVYTGICLMQENIGTCNISDPEDILIFKYLQRAGSAPTLCNHVIQYEPRKLTEEEKYENSRKQSLIDNPKLLYYYSENAQYYHDKDCVDVKEMASQAIMASESIPMGKEVCPKCRRKVFFRTACYPNTKQMPICDRIFRNNCNSSKLIEHYVMTDGMRFHATTLEELQVAWKEDTWIIKGVNGGKLELWHNNYIRTSQTERYITDGYHNQSVERSTLWQMLRYIESYSWQKHLESEQQRLAADENEQNNDVQNAAQMDMVELTDSPDNDVTYVIGSKWYVRLWNCMKRILGVG